MMSSDPFLDVLRLAEARSVLSGTLVAGGTWAFRFRSRGTMKFYVVAEGSCWLRIEGQLPPLRLDQGDVLLFWGPKTFVVGGTPKAPARDLCPVFDRGGSSRRRPRLVMTSCSRSTQRGRTSRCSSSRR